MHSDKVHTCWPFLCLCQALPSLELGTGWWEATSAPLLEPDSNCFHSNVSSGIKAKPCWVKPPCFHTNHDQGWKQAKYKSLSLTKIWLQSESECLCVNQTSKKVTPWLCLSCSLWNVLLLHFMSWFPSMRYNFIDYRLARIKLEILLDSVGWSQDIKKPLLKAGLACNTHEPHTQGATDEWTILLCG